MNRTMDNKINLFYYPWSDWLIVNVPLKSTMAEKNDFFKFLPKVVSIAYW